MMEFGGKRTDVVDFGGEMDYSHVKWFQDPPLRPAVAPQPELPSQPQYQPSRHVIEQNEGFEYALSVAPNVLYQRYKEFGQLGVLGWCAEFGELVDNLRDLGFSGNMFVTTRSQALSACEEIVHLKLEEVKMQLILMFLSSQVARLRRFLDPDRVWADYPEIHFPLEPAK